MALILVVYPTIYAHSEALLLLLMITLRVFYFFFFFSSRRRHTRSLCDWSSDVCSSDLLGVRDVLAEERAAAGSGGRRTAASDFYCPGALLGVITTPDPLTAGMDESAAIWFEESPAFETETGKVLARYAQTNPLLSGWLLGERKLFGKAALVEAPLGKGRVVLFGFRPQYRAQSWATYAPLLNAVYTSALATRAR